MKLNNLEILNINGALQALAKEKIAGAFKFKLLKLLRQIEPEAKTIIESLEITDKKRIAQTEGNKEILETEQELELNMITEKELEPLALSVPDLITLEKVIEEGE